MLKNKLEQAILQSWSERGSDHFHLEVGLSGGVDSVVLLHLLKSLQGQLGFALSAVHVNHQLQSPAAEWARFCQRLCADWGIPLRTVAVQVADQQRLGLEAAARAARYQVYADTQADTVVLAHHADDQIETAFLGWLRGGGVRALAAMPAWRPLQNDQRLPYVWRPLLHIGKQLILDYAQEWGLQHVDDPSNSDEHYLRNWLRQQILPNMLSQHPELAHKILASVEQMQRELAVLTEIQVQDWQFVHEHGVFQLKKCLSLSVARQEQQLLYFAKMQRLTAWKKAQLTHFLTELALKPQSRHQIMLGKDLIFVDRMRLYAWGNVQRQAMAAIQALNGADLGSKREFFTNSLAMSECIVNTQINDKWQIRSLSLLRNQVTQPMLTKLIAVLKQAKVPLVLIDLWPCWYDASSQTVLVAQVQDKDVRTQYPLANEALAFLRQYIIVKT
ncbi:tRNA lysidine(34) synthetase TilS [Vitreoscilla massiliensis]|uniref:tRNA(Ile)-lysidine synthase n=1 Tax=Vitreoscilla massiliensis TaxID=1689272 RepID=A0ABY4DYK7_9NEIS|nr:tRNA lysidine(34) synthetase TilS [Vitreoscilla massiliensis]UOO88614.1 tRNA lysidine(34) synthetase TilS [Vitreoscilla massiliensis]